MALTLGNDAASAGSGKTSNKSSALPARNPVRSRSSLSTTCLPSCIAGSLPLRSAAAGQDQQRHGGDGDHQQQAEDEQRGHVDRARVPLLADIVAVVGDDQKRNEGERE